MLTTCLLRKSDPLILGLCRLLVLSLLAVLAPLATYSQGAAEESEETIVKLDPFTVQEEEKSPWKSQMTFSGSRVAENVMDIPLNVTITTDDFIKDVGAFSLNDLLNYAGSGVNSRVSYRDDFSIRGFRQAATWNGLEGDVYGNTPLYDVERVEFIKGPTALVFSNVGNLGGTVNYATKRPTATSQGDLSLLVGIDNRFGADVTQRGPINSSGSVRYRVTGGFMNYDGFRELEYENNKLASAAVDWSVSKDLTVRFDVHYSFVGRRDFNRDLVDPTTGKLATSLPDDFTTTADWSKITTDLYRTRVEAVYAPSSDLSARVLYATYQNNYEYLIPQPFPGLDAAEAPNYTTIGQRMLAYDLGGYNTDLQADIVWNVDVGPTQNRLTGGWAWYSNDLATNLYLAALPDIVIGDPISSRASPPARATWTALQYDRQSRGSGWSGYVQDALTFLDGKAILSAGVRYVSESGTQSGEAVTVPRYGFVYKFNPSVSAYYGYAESFTPLTGTDILGNPYTDITGQNQEFGLKLDMFDGRLFGSVAYFDMSNDPVVTQVQVTDSMGNVLYGNMQTAEETNKGVEVDLGVVLDAGPGQVIGMGTYYSADPQNAQGQRPARVVDYKGTLFTKYEFTSGPLNGFSFGGGVSDFGDQVGTGIAVQDGYTLYSLLFGYRTENWKIALNIDNATDVKDAVVGSEASFSVYTARPRDMRLSVTYNW